MATFFLGILMFIAGIIGGLCGTLIIILLADKWEKNDKND